VKIDALTALIQRISRKADEQVSILVGKEAISYFSIDNKSQQLSENIFMLRNGHPIAEELQCVITTMAQQGKMYPTTITIMLTRPSDITAVVRHRTTGWR
jgi:hypothetical protein